MEIFVLIGFSLVLFVLRTLSQGRKPKPVDRSPVPPPPVPVQAPPIRRGASEPELKQETTPAKPPKVSPSPKQPRLSLKKAFVLSQIFKRIDEG